MQATTLRNNFIGIGVSLSFLFVSCSRRAPAKPTTAAALPVTVALAEARNMPVEVRAIGRVQPYSTVTVRSQITGQLIKTHFQEGQKVKTNDLLFTIDPRPPEAALNQARADLAESEAKLDQAARDWDRAQKLGPSEALAQSAYDTYKANYDIAQAAVLASRAAVSNAALNVEFTQIRSPIDGRTGNILIKEGNIIKAEDDQIVTINQVQPIYVAFSVPEQQLPAIRKRMQQAPLEVTAEAAGMTNDAPRGQLAFINNTVDLTTGTILLRAVFPNQDNALWPGQFVNAVLTLDTQTNAVVVPSQAVQLGQQGEFVFVVKPDKTAEVRPVGIGERINEETILRNGVQPGEQVVTSGQLRLAPGVKVEIQNAGASPPRMAHL
jgi:multidrug efflux system membrane fusion protein